MRSYWLACAALFPAGAVAQVHSPDVEARLAALVGDWTLEGQEATYRETCEWYRNRSFVVCTSEDKSDNSTSQSILGYSKAKGHFTYHNFGSSGSSRSELGFAHGERGLVYTAERSTGQGIARITTWLEPDADGRLRFRREQSLDGGPWEQRADFHYVPRTP